MGIYHDHSDEEITYLLGKADQSSMKMIFSKYYSPLCSYAMRYVISFDDAEDVVQSVLASLWINKNGVNFSGSLRSYLFGAVSKASLKLIRDRKQTYIGDIEARTDDCLNDILSYSEKQRTKMISDINMSINLLPDNQKKVFTGIVLHNKPYKEIASDLGISVNTVKTHYARAIKQLREKFRSHG